MKNDRVLKALRLQPVDKIPIWIMRQSGRYLPEYQELRKKSGSFLNLCYDPNLATTATLIPLKRFDLDAAIIFSDILLVPHALGMELNFVETQGPVFTYPIRDLSSIHRLKESTAIQNLTPVLEAIDRVKSHLKVPLLGFAGSPFTLATYMVEGASSHKGFVHAKKFLYREPAAFHSLLSLLSEVVINFLYVQIQAGVEAVMLFDTWGGLLSDGGYIEFSLYYLQYIIKALKQKAPHIPIILYAKQAHQWDKIIQTGCDALSIDWTHSLKSVHNITQGKIALQGNLDPHVLYASDATIKAEVTRILTEFGPYAGHIFNLGHGVLPDIDPEKVKFLIDCVHNFVLEPP